ASGGLSKKPGTRRVCSTRRDSTLTKVRPRLSTTLGGISMRLVMAAGAVSPLAAGGGGGVSAVQAASASSKSSQGACLVILFLLRLRLEAGAQQRDNLLASQGLGQGGLENLHARLVAAG